MAPLRLIAGSGRSGTTWVLDVLTVANKLRPVFEPLHPLTCGEVAQRYANRYLTRMDRQDDLAEFIEAAAAGQLNNMWVNYRSISRLLDVRLKRFGSVASVKKWVRDWQAMLRRVQEYRPLMRHPETIVKVIRGNLMLDWLSANFPLRTIFLVRHPAAVIESQLRYEIAWEPSRILARYSEDRALMTGPLADYADFLNSSMSRAAAYTTVWAIQNMIPMAQAKQNGYTVVFYEELLESPGTEWRRIVDALELEQMPETDLLNQPSQQATRDIGESSYAKSYAKWRQALSTEELEEIQRTLDRFSIDCYRVDQERPVLSG